MHYTVTVSVLLLKDNRRCWSNPDYGAFVGIVYMPLSVHT